MAFTGAAASVLFLLVLLLVVATADYYVPPSTTYAPPQPYVPKPTTTYTSPKPNPDMAIEGLILCKSGYKTYPIQGYIFNFILCDTYQEQLFN